MFKSLELIDVSKSHNFVVVYERIFISHKKYYDDDNHYFADSFYCVTRKTENDFLAGNEFEVESWSFARTAEEIKPQEVKKIKPSGLNLQNFHGFSL